MAILWCGGEDIDFPNGSLVDVGTTNLYFRSGYARCAIRSMAGLAVAKSSLFSGGEISSGWLHCYVYVAGTSASNFHVGFGKSSTSKYIGIGHGNPYTKLTLFSYDGTTLTALAVETGNSLTQGQLYTIDIQLINYGASSTINVYVDENLTITYAGSTSISGVTGFDSVFLGGVSGAYFYTSEIIVSDEDTRNLIGLKTLVPTGNGTHTDMSNDYTAVDEITTDPSDRVYSDTDGHQESFTLTDLDSTDVAIKAIKVAAHATKSSDSTPTSLNLGVRSGLTTNVNDNHPLTLSWSTVERLMQVNPVTSVAFTPAEANAMELALEVEA